jgi:hypothetical protein
MDLVKCIKCAEEKPRDAFGRNPGKLNGLQSRCRECDRKLKAQDPDKRRWDQIKRLYGLSKEGFMVLWQSQQGRCEICSDHLSLDRKGGFATDHNHLTGEVRGLLCKPCNHALGLFKDSPSVLEAATVYLKTKGHYGQCIGGT